MDPFRARWPDRSGFILAMVGVSLGLGVVRQTPLVASGVELLVWMVALATLVAPLMVLELAIGVIFQGALSESLRKSDKRLEWLGWVAAGMAFLALVAAGVTVGELAISGYDSLLAAIADQPLPWATQPGRPAEPTHATGAVLVAVAAIMALIDLRLWRGAPSIARTAVLVVPSGLVALALLIAILATRPGAVDGMARWLTPDAHGWGALLHARIWLDSYAYALSTWMLGLGIYTAFGSYLNRSSDVTGIAGVAVLAAALGQLLLMMVVFVASGLAGGATAGAAFAAVPTAIANLGIPLWSRGLTATIWFAALLAFALPALLALAEAVVAPIVDKFRLPRERVVAGVCLAAFFCAALVAIERGHPWLAIGDPTLLGGVAALAASLAMLAWWKVDLDALQRHLNAYSAFRVGIGWRVLVSAAVTLSAVAVAVDRLAVRLLAPGASVAGAGASVGAQGMIVVGMLMALLLTALVVSRLPARGA